ncbi:hypothetical protein [Streptomyces griseorubiginosus]|nr:hypothetical protein [Streptomyces griseorubiginosus]
MPGSQACTSPAGTLRRPSSSSVHRPDGVPPDTCHGRSLLALPPHITA